MEQPLEKWFFVIHRQRQGYIRETLRGESLEPGMIPFVFHVYRSCGLRQEDLSAEMGLDKTTVAHAVKKLAHLGFLSRTRDREDRRCNRLAVTEAGRTLCEKLDHVFQEWNAGLQEGFSEEERAAGEDFLRRLGGNARRLADDARMRACSGQRNQE